MSEKKKSFYYRDWKYKIRWNERATPIMTGHMNLIRLTHKSLEILGVYKLLKIRRADTYELKRRFRFKKNINW